MELAREHMGIFVTLKMTELMCLKQNEQIESLRPSAGEAGALDQVSGSLKLTPISHKDFNEFIKGKGFTKRNDCKLKDLKAAFGFKSLNERIRLVVSAEDMEPTHFNSIMQANSALGVKVNVINYAKKKGKKTFKRTIDGQNKIFSVEFY